MKVCVDAEDLADLLDRVDRLPTAEQPHPDRLRRLRSVLRPKLNQAQEIALVQLVENESEGGRPLQTSNRNRGRCIAYRTAETLEKAGLVRIRPRLSVSGAFYEVLVTDEGRALVEG